MTHHHPPEASSAIDTGDRQAGPEITCYIGLGANLGDRLDTLRAATRALATASAEFRLVRASSVFESAPWGVTDQPWFLNAVVEGATTLGPFRLLSFVKQIEVELGRVPGRRWGPRAIDLDILLAGDLWLRSSTLNVPHLQLTNRAFALAPLVELLPNLRLADRGRAADRLNTLLTTQAVTRRGILLDSPLESPPPGGETGEV